MGSLAAAKSKALCFNQARLERAERVAEEVAASADALSSVAGTLRADAVAARREKVSRVGILIRG